MDYHEAVQLSGSDVGQAHPYHGSDSLTTASAAAAEANGDLELDAGDDDAAESADKMEVTASTRPPPPKTTFCSPAGHTASSERPTQSNHYHG